MTPLKEMLAEPVWNVAKLFPAQGTWSEEEYLALDTNQLVEFAHGRLEILDMPSEQHQDFVLLLAEMLKRYARHKKAGKVVIAPFPIQLWPGKFREPDIAFMLAEHHARRTTQHWIGADLVMEVLSSDRSRDLVTKRREYAQAGFSEYWIVDPLNREILLLTLASEQYIEHGPFRLDERVESHLLPGFVITPRDLFEDQSE